MCGIIGSNFLSLGETEEGLRTIASRGPDSFNVIVHDNFILGQCRLAIQDVHSTIIQPIIKNGTALVYNGELWNNCVAGLQSDLGNNSISDTVLLFDAYQKYGTELFGNLDGVFGAAFIKENEVCLVRDYIGEIPLYYYHDGSKFMFASEKKAFIGMDIKKITLLLPGHFLKFKDGEIQITPYYSLPMNEITDDKETIINNLNLLLTKGIEKRIPREVDYCVLLSGGIDSTITAYLLKNYNPKLEAFTMHLDIGKDKKVLRNDLYFARVAAKHLNIRLHEIIITEKDVENYLEETVKVIEDNSWTQISSGLPHLLMGKYIKEHTNYKIVFSGSGSDEIFASYPIQKRFQWLDHQYDAARRKLIANLHENNIIRENKCLLASSLEVRSPFLDRQFLEYALNIPIKYRFENKKMKPMLRYAFEKHLTPELSWREKICEGAGVGIESLIKDKKSDIKKIYQKLYG